MSTINSSSIIKKQGFEVKVTSWENDADHYKTISNYLETKDDALFYIEILKAARLSYHRQEGAIGNATVGCDVSFEDVVGVFQDAYIKFPNISESIKEELKDVLAIDIGSIDLLEEPSVNLLDIQLIMIIPLFV